jgi:uncharacterized protein with GYD domain
MPTYITLVNYTDQGIQNIKDAPKRLRDVKKLMASMGGKFKAAYLTLGGYDLVTIGEAPDDETMAKAILTIAGQGNVRTTTMRAFNEAEIKDIVSSLP